MKNSWFEVDKKGLQSLQEGKSKTFVLRELIQNAFDEDITFCKVTIEWKNGNTKIKVEDDNPEGFKDLSHAYTLYSDTYKRRDSLKRGRFNLGEKQALSICTFAEIITTKGSIIFDKKGRHKLGKKCSIGSSILMEFKSTKAEYQELIEYGNMILVPKNIDLYINDRCYKHKTPFKIFNAKLRTEIEINGVLRGTIRSTNIYIHKDNKSFLYELGIPVCEIDCDYSLDVQQKIPLSMDREKVSTIFLKELYTEVLNITFDEITKENVSNLWIRTATEGKNINKDAIYSVVKKRFGDQTVIANPLDKNSIDKAISNNYNVVYGNEMNKKEWENIRKFDIMKSSSKLFGSTLTNDFEIVNASKEQKEIADWIIIMAYDMMNINITIKFIKSKSVSYIAEYGDKTLTFNLTKIPETYWILEDNVINVDLLDLVIHELGHEKGLHYETSYHQCITRLGAKLVWKMKQNPNWFNIKIYDNEK